MERRIFPLYHFDKKHLQNCFPFETQSLFDGEKSQVGGKLDCFLWQIWICWGLPAEIFLWFSTNLFQLLCIPKYEMYVLLAVCLVVKCGESSESDFVHAIGCGWITSPRWGPHVFVSSAPAMVSMMCLGDESKQGAPVVAARLLLHQLVQVLPKLVLVHMVDASQVHLHWF